MKITIALPKKTLHTSHNVLGLHGLRALLATTVLISRNWKPMQHSLIWLLFSLHWPLGYSLLSFYSWSGLQFPAWGFPTQGPNLHLPLSPTLLSSVQPLSRVWLFATPWTAAHQASLSITNSQSLLKLMSTESVMPSNHLFLCRPLLLLPSIFPRIGVFSLLCIRWPKYWSFNFSINPYNEYSGLISFRIDWFDLLAIPWRDFSNTTVQKHQFFGVQLSLWSNSYMHTWLLEKPKLLLDGPLWVIMNAKI